MSLVSFPDTHLKIFSFGGTLRTRIFFLALAVRSFINACKTRSFASNGKVAKIGFALPRHLFFGKIIRLDACSMRECC